MLLGNSVSHGPSFRDGGVACHLSCAGTSPRWCLMSSISLNLVVLGSRYYLGVAGGETEALRAFVIGCMARKQKRQTLSGNGSVRLHMAPRHRRPH